jgi:hypothetical protein
MFPSTGDGFAIRSPWVGRPNEAHGSTLHPLRQANLQGRQRFCSEPSEKRSTTSHGDIATPRTTKSLETRIFEKVRSIHLFWRGEPGCAALASDRATTEDGLVGHSAPPFALGERMLSWRLPRCQLRVITECRGCFTTPELSRPHDVASTRKRTLHWTFDAPSQRARGVIASMTRRCGEAFSVVTARTPTV